MTGREFRQDHGDPATWTNADMETFEHLEETKDIVLPDPTPADPQPVA
jgi:hypothetical protein